MTHQFDAILETSTLIMNIIMKLIFGIYMKNFYFFDISLSICHSDMKQTAKNSVRSMLSYPFTLFWILAYTFFVFFMLPFFCLDSRTNLYLYLTQNDHVTLWSFQRSATFKCFQMFQMSIHLSIFI